MALKNQGQSVKSDNKEKSSILQHGLDEMHWSKRKATFTIWNLRRMKATEILVKIIAFAWAIIWSAASIICLFSDGLKLLAPLVMLPATGFWVLLARSSGSVTELEHEIREKKKI